eukprot:NODE_8311_length_415_cov_48.196721_g7442_i0.p1 GENE.NODE_8311_length_415_cov_48.196721_g7442_i0~~NODE_8311_length_415_cov_48.196721_g7442_i0.p1  ORF type:complete len:112 (+),score=28.68 NODE_8311_length_415_cov_48.196721_g7442_i0:37-336(+)
MVLVDIHILVRAGEFIGNPVSSFSALICQLRQAQGRRCVNMPPDIYPGQCIAFPDSYNLFLSWTLESKLLPGVAEMTPCKGNAYQNLEQRDYSDRIRLV